MKNKKNDFLHVKNHKWFLSMIRIPYHKNKEFGHFKNNRNLLKCKKSSTISIILLVILTLALVVLTLTYFITSQRQTSAVFNVPSEIDGVYDDSLYFNIYLTGMFDKATSGFKFEDGKNGFLERFKSETGKTLFYSKYGNKITYGPVSDDKIELTKDKIVLNVDIEITNNETSGKGIIVKYDYRKTFEKKFD